MKTTIVRVPGLGRDWFEALDRERMFDDAARLESTPRPWSHHRMAMCRARSLRRTATTAGGRIGGETDQQPVARPAADNRISVRARAGEISTTRDDAVREREASRIARAYEGGPSVGLPGSAA